MLPPLLSTTARARPCPAGGRAPPCPTFCCRTPPDDCHPSRKKCPSGTTSGPKSSGMGRTPSGSSNGMPSTYTTPSSIFTVCPPIAMHRCRNNCSRSAAYSKATTVSCGRHVSAPGPPAIGNAGEPVRPQPPASRFTKTLPVPEHRQPAGKCASVVAKGSTSRPRARATSLLNAVGGELVGSLGGRLLAYGRRHLLDAQARESRRDLAPSRKQPAQGAQHRPGRRLVWVDRHGVRRAVVELRRLRRCVPRDLLACSRVPPVRHRCAVIPVARNVFPAAAARRLIMASTTRRVNGLPVSVDALEQPRPPVLEPARLGSSAGWSTRCSRPGG